MTSPGSHDLEAIVVNGEVVIELVATVTASAATAWGKTGSPW